MIIEKYYIIVLILICSQSVIESVNAGLRAAWINYFGQSPLTQAVCLRDASGAVGVGVGCRRMLVSMDSDASVYN